MKKRINTIKNKVLVQGGTNDELKEHEIRLNSDLSFTERINGKIVDSSGDNGEQKLTLQYISSIGTVSGDVSYSKIYDSNGNSADENNAKTIIYDPELIISQNTDIECIKLAENDDIVLYPGISPKPPIVGVKITTIDSQNLISTTAAHIKYNEETVVERDVIVSENVVGKFTYKIFLGDRTEDAGIHGTVVYHNQIIIEQTYTQNDPDSIYTKDYILAGNGSSDYIKIQYEIPSNNGTGFIYSGNLKYSGFNKFYVWGN